MPCFVLQITGKLPTSTDSDNALILFIRDQEQYILHGYGSNQVNSLPNIEKTLRSQDEETRRGALTVLREQSLHEARDLLFFAMGDESWRVRKEAVDVFVAMNPDEMTIELLLELLRNQENAGLRNSAAEAVGRIGSRATIPLIRLMGDHDEDVRKFVIDVMGIIGSPEFVPALLSALGDPDVNVASAAAEHLGNIGDSRAVPNLIKTIIDNDSILFRFSALAALGKLTSHVSVPAEIVMLADQDILRKSVYECLGSIGDESVMPILMQGFLSRQKSSRNAAITGWYRIFSRSSATDRQAFQDTLQRLSGSETVPALIDSFDLQDTTLAEAITVLLGIIGDIRGAKTLLSAFASERISGSALASLKRLGSRGMDVLIALYPQSDEIGRYAICKVVGDLAYRAGGMLIREALRDPSQQVRSAAVTAVGILGLTDCITDIVSLLDDTDSDVRTSVIACLQVLARIDRSSIQDVARQLEGSELPEQRREAVILNATLGDGDRLTLLVKDENATVRQAAVTSIGKLHFTSANNILLIALVDEDPDVRIAAAEALGAVGGADVLPFLTHALNDEDCWVQCAVLRSIAHIDKSSALQAIQSISSTAEGLLMITCLELLETIGSHQAMDLVERALDSDDRDVASLAIAILVRQGGEWVLANAERLMSHPRLEVRSAWAEVLAELPPQQAKGFLLQALKRDENSPIKIYIQGLLEGVA